MIKRLNSPYSLAGAKHHLARHHDTGQLRAGQRALASKHFHIQPQDLQSGGSSFQARGSLDHDQQRRLLFASHAHHLHMSDAFRRLSIRHTSNAF